MAKYRVTNGINFSGKRAEPGDVVELTPGQADALKDSVRKVSKRRPSRKVSGGTDVS